MRKLRIHLPVSRLFAPGEIYAGIGSVGILAGVGASRMAVLVSRSVAASESKMRAIAAVTRRVASTTIEMPSGEPTLESIRRPLSEVTDFRPDWIVAIGGGSVIDGGKLVWSLYEHPSLTQDVMARPHGLPALRGKAHFAAAPTTAGSGAEASAVAVYQSKAGARKSFLVSYDLLPDLAILDPVMVRGIPRGALLASAGDALAHAVEGYASRSATTITDALAETAVRRLVRAMPAITDETPDSVVSELLVGACLAGIIQNFAPPGLGHAIAHQLAHSAIPHAVATSSLLPRAVAANVAASEAVGAKYSELANVLNLADSAALVPLLRDLVDDIQPRFDELTTSTVVHDTEFLAGVLGDPCARTNPIPLTPDLIASTFEGVVA